MKSHPYYKVVACLVLVLLSVSAFAQTITAEIDRDRIFIGEQVQLQLKITNFDPRDKIIQNWFNLPDTINHLEVVERQKVDTIEVNGMYSFEQKITLTSFDSGQWEIPPLMVIVNDRVNNKINTEASRPLAIQVLPVDVSELADYHDIKEIIEVEEKNNPAIIAIIIVLTLACLFGLYKLAKAKKKSVIARPVLGNKSPLDWALAELDKLAGQNLSTAIEVKRYYQQLTDICRQFFHQQFQQAALQQTTDEWMLQLQSSPVEAGTKTAFFQMLRLADTVKFAKYLPPSGENEGAVPVAKRMLVEALSQNHFTSKPQAKSL